MTRDNLLLGLGFVASVGAYAVAHTSLIPPVYVETVKDLTTRQVQQ